MLVLGSLGSYPDNINFELCLWTVYLTSSFFHILIYIMGSQWYLPQSCLKINEINIRKSLRVISDMVIISVRIGRLVIEGLL